MSSHDYRPRTPPKRKRRTRAEREAAEAARRAELAAQPIDPLVWILLGVVVLFVAGMTWLDPVTLANSGNNPSILQFIPVLMIRIFGHTLASVILTVLGVIPLVWGFVGWVRKRAGKT